ncbi:hypothetical protein ENUP19_0218G0028 [Entamoeba nuttalli]|uniref:Uncharacterized protein n=1 Tax=Entamoeba nuttalli TaxID=412467 RepID=A0ABQ0DPI1_9EUKA
MRMAFTVGSDKTRIRDYAFSVEVLRKTDLKLDYIHIHHHSIPDNMLYIDNMSTHKLSLDSGNEREIGSLSIICDSIGYLI